jgi:hypothetical protein
MYAIAVVLLLMIVAASIFPMSYGNQRENFDIRPTSSKYYVSANSAAEFDRTISAMDINTRSEPFIFKRCYHFTKSYTEALKSLTDHLNFNRVSYMSLISPTELISTSNFDALQQSINKTLIDVKKYLGDIQGDVYAVIFQFPKYRDASGNEIAITSFNAQLNMSDLSDKDSTFQAPSSGNDKIVYKILLIFDGYSGTPPRYSESNKKFSNTIMPAFDSSLYSKEYPCFMSVVGNPTLPGGCASHTNLSANIQSTCLGPSTAIGYNGTGSVNPDPKTTVSTFATVYKVNLPLVFNNSGYTFTKVPGGINMS